MNRIAISAGLFVEELSSEDAAAWFTVSDGVLTSLQPLHDCPWHTEQHALQPGVPVRFFRVGFAHPTASVGGISSYRCGSGGVVVTALQGAGTVLHCQLVPDGGMTTYLETHKVFVDQDGALRLSVGQPFKNMMNEAHRRHDGPRPGAERGGILSRCAPR